MFIIILLLCVCIFWMILWYYNRYIHYLECLSGLFVTCLVIFILVPLIGFFNSTDSSTHSTRLMRTTFYPYWVEEYTYETCSGDEDDRTCTTHTDYIKHEEHWSAHDGFETEYNISKGQFDKIRYKFGNRQIVKKPLKPGFHKGDRHIYVYNNQTNTYEYPIVTTRVWQNYRKGSKNSLFSKTKHTTMKYPAPNPPINSNRLHVQGIDITRKQWDIFNTKVYEKLPVNIAPQVSMPSIQTDAHDLAAATQSQTPTTQKTSVNTEVITSPMVGTFYRAPSPDSAPYVNIGDKVKKGQTIAIIDPEKLNQSVDNFIAQLQSAKAELYSAEVQLENKQWNYENYLNLYNKTNGKSPSQMQLKTSELEYKSAKAEIEIKKAAIKQLETSLNSAKIDVKNSIITSPTNGVILSRSIEPGQTVAANFSTPTLFTIAKDLSKMKLISNVLEADIGKVKVGQDVIFSVDSYPNEEFSAKVAKVNYADSSSTSSNSSSSSSSGSSSSSSATNIVSYEVTTYINNDKLLLRPGMSATATIKTEVQKNALIIPYQALLFKPTNNVSKNNSGGFAMGGPPKRERKSYSEIGSSGKIWILEDGIPKEIEVKIGISNGKNIQVLSDNIDTKTQVILQVQTK